MLGERILARSLSAQRIEDMYGNKWQYNSQSDNHSKLACWSAMFDLMLNCPLVVRHIAAGQSAFGINHSMVNPQTNESKKLDLVICTPRAVTTDAPVLTFARLAQQYGVVLSADEQVLLADLPPAYIRPVAAVLVAMESKAAMTKHASNQRRQRGEFGESLDAILGAQHDAIAVAYGIVNASDEFVSPPSNRRALGGSFASATMKHHTQPRDTEAAFRGLSQMHIRTTTRDRGYDAVGITTIILRNDHSPVTVAPSPPAIDPSHGRSYESMIHRICGLYVQRFTQI